MAGSSVIVASVVTEFMPLELWASHGRESLMTTIPGPGVVIVDGVLAKALAAKHRVPLRNLKAIGSCRVQLSGHLSGKDGVGPPLAISGRDLAGCQSRSDLWRAEAIIALTAFLKSARLLMAQKASNQTASCAASIIASVGCRSGLKAAAANLR
jgi:hypothetical protein